MPTPINYPVPVYTATFSTVSTYSNEQVFALSPVVNVDSPQATVNLRVTGTLTPGTNGVTATFKIRKGSTTSGNAPTYGGLTGALTVVATDPLQFVVEGVDLPGAVAGQQYCVTVTVGSASAASVLADVLFTAVVAGPA